MHLLIALAVAVRPFFGAIENEAPSSIGGPPEWPTSFNGETLTEQPLAEKERRWLKDFPGQVRSFSSQSRHLVVRYVHKPTRKLHPARDCFKGSGYATHHLPLLKDGEGHLWGCFRAERDEQSLRVCERIYDLWGNEFTDVSAWFWGAILNTSDGPWWVMTVVESAN